MKYFITIFVQQNHLLDKYSNILQNARYIHLKKINTLSANMMERKEI